MTENTLTPAEQHRATNQPRFVTRRAEISRAAWQADVLSLPEGVTWLYLPGLSAPLGEFPHASTAEPCCPASLALQARGGTKQPPYDIWCTRPDGHTSSDPLHVAHVGVGSPVVAWNDDPSLAPDGFPYTEPTTTEQES